jgi:hypothetical protein
VTSFNAESLARRERAPDRCAASRDGRLRQDSDCRRESVRGERCDSVASRLDDDGRRTHAPCDRAFASRSDSCESPRLSHQTDRAAKRSACPFGQPTHDRSPCIRPRGSGALDRHRSCRIPEDGDRRDRHTARFLPAASPVPPDSPAIERIICPFGQPTLPCSPCVRLFHQTDSPSHETRHLSLRAADSPLLVALRRERFRRERVPDLGGADRPRPKRAPGGRGPGRPGTEFRRTRQLPPRSSLSAPKFEDCPRDGSPWTPAPRPSPRIDPGPARAVRRSPRVKLPRAVRRSPRVKLPRASSSPRIEPCCAVRRV